MPLRKPTLLITTATFLLPMSDYVMTWERRWVVLGCYLWSILYQSSALLRQELKRLQKYKGIKIVKKYRDSQGKRRVVSCLIERRRPNHFEHKIHQHLALRDQWSELDPN